MCQEHPRTDVLQESSAHGGPGHEVALAASERSTGFTWRLRHFGPQQQRVPRLLVDESSRAQKDLRFELPYMQEILSLSFGAFDGTT